MDYLSPRAPTMTTMGSNDQKIAFSIHLGIACTFIYLAQQTQQSNKPNSTTVPAFRREGSSHLTGPHSSIPALSKT